MYPQILQKARLAIGRAAVRLAGQMAAYDVNGGGLRIRGWNPGGNDSINALIEAGGENLRRYSRDTVRKNPWARQAVRTFTGNAIGAGIVPQSKHPDEAMARKIEAAWLKWTDEADADGTCDFYGLQALACRSTVEGGEAFARTRPRRRTDGLTVPLQLQVLEAEFLPLNDTRTAESGNKVRWGIEYDKIGRRQAYHFYRSHPGEQPLQGVSLEQTRIPADSAMHLFQPIRPGQQRGEPWLAPALLPLYELEKWDSATLVAKGLAALFAFFIRDLDGTSSAPLFNDAKEGKDAGGNPIQAVEPGSTITLPRGKTVEFPELPDVGSAYGEYLTWQLHKVAAAVGVPFHLLTGRLNDVNYSSIRAGLLEFRRMVEAFQHLVMVYQFCRPVWRNWMDAAAIVGVIPARQYALDSDPFLAVEWIPQPWPWVDPLKDMQAEVLAIDNLLTSRAKVAKGMGTNIETLDQEIAAEQKSESEKGLKRHNQKADSTDQQANGGTNGNSAN